MYTCLLLFGVFLLASYFCACYLLLIVLSVIAYDYGACSGVQFAINSNKCSVRMAKEQFVANTLLTFSATAQLEVQNKSCEK